MIQKTHNLLQTILKPVELSPLKDGLLRIGDKVMLLHIPTQSVISAYMSAAEAHEATQLVTDSQVSCSKCIQPCPRNVFVIGSMDESVKIGDIVCYGQQIIFTTLPGEGGELKLYSDSFSFMKHSKYSREQEVKLVEETSYRCVWRLLCFDQRDRLETEGEPIQVSKPLFINHCKTNEHLAVHTEYCPSTPFGREYEVTACTKLNTHKVEDTHNHFMIFDPTSQ